jgi:hypothetical protein
MREMKFDLPAHFLNLQADRARHFVLSSRVGPVGFLGQYSQRRFQSMGEITCFCQRPPHGPFTVFEQGIKIVYQRLHFDRIRSFNSAAGTVAHARQLFAKPTQRGEAGAYLPNPCHHAEKREHKSQRRIDASDDNSARVLVVHSAEYQVHQRNQSKGPEESAQKNAPAERMHPVHESAFMR